MVQLHLKREGVSPREFGLVVDDVLLAKRLCSHRRNIQDALTQLTLARLPNGLLQQALPARHGGQAEGWNRKGWPLAGQPGGGAPSRHGIR